ncbi:unnamed protein product (macronuclear) [Paramecium tetraurelia]|uniref:Transmembrane protein n=1 Tax=Paramecium tetraurelia TaxID=5888 RepID=A0BYM1_PARTE|nr:uncharacterized protein GSPATT00033491001 [Paramecium tetraurelia]CAK63638.1 unnamed protein product [Paramecium tetraurelia]|eukprot:XP_001431036.1 hypothetical protein (macronuclear) [Paramecium tetraurelia strain d4-2]
MYYIILSKSPFLYFLRKMMSYYWYPSTLQKLIIYANLVFRRILFRQFRKLYTKLYFKENQLKPSLVRLLIIKLKNIVVATFDLKSTSPKLLSELLKTKQVQQFRRILNEEYKSNIFINLLFIKIHFLKISRQNQSFKNLRVLSISRRFIMQLYSLQFSYKQIIYISKIELIMVIDQLFYRFKMLRVKLQYLNEINQYYNPLNSLKKLKLFLAQLYKKQENKDENL